MAAIKKGIILVLGDHPFDMSQIVRQVDPQAFGFLCYTNKGLAGSTEFTRDGGIDLSCCQFEVIHGLSNKREFFRKVTALKDFLLNQCRAEITAVCIGTGNLEALALAAVVAHQNQTLLRINNADLHLTIDSGGAILVEHLSTIVKEFNLHHYRDVLSYIEKIISNIKTSKGRTYFSLLTKLAKAYHSWDCRKYEEAYTCLIEAKALLDTTKDDFSHIYEYFTSKLQLNTEFLGKLNKNKVILGGLDAFFNGNRRYDAADNLVCILALANSVEFCLRARLLARNYNPDDVSKLNRSLLKDFGEKARQFFIDEKLFHVEAFDSESESPNATVTPKFSHKPGFMDLLKILAFIGDDFFKEIVTVLDAPENPDYLSILQLNSLRNKVVHKMGTVSDEDLPKAIKLTEYIIERFLDRLVKDIPDAFPELRAESTDNLMLQAANYATYVRLDLRDITVGIFS